MYAHVGLFSDSDDEPDIEIDEPNLNYGLGPRRPWRQNLVHVFEGNDHFLKIIQSVTEEERKGITTEDEEILFNKISLHLMKPYIPFGILTLQRLAYIPSTVSAARLEEIANIICMKVFNPLTDINDDILVYSDFSKAFAYLKATTHEGISVTFEQILIKAFIDELSKKFGYEQRLERLLWNRDIPQEKKEKWLNKQIEEQQRVFKTIIRRSVCFLERFFHLYPEIVLRVIEFLLKSEGEDRFQYLCALVEVSRLNGGFGSRSREADYTNIYDMKMLYWNRYQERFLDPPVPVSSKDLTHLIENINFLSRENYIVTPHVRDLIQNRIFNGIDKKVNCPQDYIKYCIKDHLLSENVIPKDDFEIDDEDDCDCNLYTLQSRYHMDNARRFDARRFDTRRFIPSVFWKGLKVKILTKKSANKPAHRGRFALQNRRTAHK